MSFLSKYKFTNKRHPLKAILSVNLALIGIVALFLSIYLSYRSGGEGNARYAAALSLSFLMSLAGLVLALISRTEPDRYYLFPNLGIILNTLVILACGWIFALGLGWIG
ncbi:MAG: hypothetical protein IK115_12805 [Lachnospiraceae bacterium]|nr:hypothetical protein [Lachnospiraceae bacterium]